MDDLSQSLNCCKTGCLSGEIMIYHLMYAYDLVLLLPSATGLRELRHTFCEKYSKEHAIIYNSKKSSVANDATDDADMMRQRRQLYTLGNVSSRRFHMCSI